MFILICLLTTLFIPSIAEAWGPLTHAYLGNQVLELGATIIPAGIYSLLKRYRNDFLYGNLSADIILGRKFQAFEKNSHNWDIAWKLLEVAKTGRQAAFAYGYLTHLSADTVVHNLKDSKFPFKHSLLEVKSDSVINRKHGNIVRDIDRITQRKNDIFLEGMLESLFFSFKTNRRIFKGLLFLSRLHNYSPVSNFIHQRFPYGLPVIDIYEFQHESLQRMFELLKNGRNSKVLRKNPLGKHHKDTFRLSIYQG